MKVWYCSKTKYQSNHLSRHGVSHTNEELQHNGQANAAVKGMKILYSLKWAIEYHSDVCWFLNAQWKIWTLILLQLAPLDIASSVYCFDFWLVQWERWICIWPTRLSILLLNTYFIVKLNILCNFKAALLVLTRDLKSILISFPW